MPQLTNTKDQTSLRFTIPSLQHEVTVHLPDSPKVASLLPDRKTHRILEIPVSSKWEPGAHWHEDYVEHIRVLKGRAKVWVNGVVREIGPGEEVIFNLFDIHNFCRATFDSDEELLIEEWTENGKTIN